MMQNMHIVKGHVVRKNPRCTCPLYCKFCGAALRLDAVGHKCPTHNCQWQHGVPDCTASR